MRNPTLIFSKKSEFLTLLVRSTNLETKLKPGGDFVENASRRNYFAWFLTDWDLPEDMAAKTNFYVTINPSESIFELIGGRNILKWKYRTWHFLRRYFHKQKNWLKSWQTKYTVYRKTKPYWNSWFFGLLGFHYVGCSLSGATFQFRKLFIASLLDLVKELVTAKMGLRQREKPKLFAHFGDFGLRGCLGA